MRNTARSFRQFQSRPDTAMQGYDPTTGEWNDSLTGDFTWSRANFGEATPDVMTLFTWSMWQIHHAATTITIGHYPTVGNICGRAYGNLSVGVSLFRSLGKSLPEALQALEEPFGHVPDEIQVPTISLSRRTILPTMLLGLVSRRIRLRRWLRAMPGVVAASPERCSIIRQQIQGAGTGPQLISLWRDVLKPYFVQMSWLTRLSVMRYFNFSAPLRRELTTLMGDADANALLSNLGGTAELASLGPLIGLSRVARGGMSRDAYLKQYGHRGPHELELSMPHPAEAPDWLDRQLTTFAQSPVDVDALLARQESESASAWRRFADRYPQQAPPIWRRIAKASESALLREAVRSEFTRLAAVCRAWALRAGELSGLGDGVFQVTINELLDVLGGDKAVTAYIPARAETYTRYCSLPSLPTIISGRFDPAQWAADPGRRTDIFDSHVLLPAPVTNTITGFAGAAGRVEGVVHCLNRVEEGDQFRPGEILVAVTTNVGWTPLFPRAAAVVTDVGAPLSHAAIVARELGIPAVVGCINATARLKTGDRVLVDGGRGVVEILTAL